MMVLQRICDRISTESQSFPEATDTTVDGWLVAIRKADAEIATRILSLDQRRQEMESTIDNMQKNADAAHDLLQKIVPWANRLVRIGDRLVDGDSIDCEEIIKEFAEWWKGKNP